jgi:hypothetical protein
MKTVRAVFFKEITDNFRDRRTLMTALLMGPLFGPILFAFVINLWSVHPILLPICKATTSTLKRARPRVKRRLKR